MKWVKRWVSGDAKSLNSYSSSVVMINMNVVSRLARQAKLNGYQRDESRTALRLAEMDRPEISVLFHGMRRYLIFPGEIPTYLAILEETDGAEVSGRDGDIKVPAGGAMVVYRCGTKRYDGFFNRRGKPLHETARKIQERAFA